MKLALLGVLIYALSACGGITPGAPCVTDGDCQEGLACGPLETCEEPRMIDGCRMTQKCQEYGYCLAHEGHCRATDASCKASLYCQMEGKCSVQKGGIGCTVASDVDCAAADVCKVSGKCVAYDERCVPGKPAAEAEGDTPAAEAK